MTDGQHSGNNPNLQASDLAASSDGVEPVELLADDFMRRQRAGEQPTIEEYCDRHPALADEIRDVFPALMVIEQVAPDSADLKVSHSPLESPDHRPIERVGEFRVLREIGRGGMGVVYEAEQESLGRRVALKVLPQHAAGDARSLMRFQREARAAAKLHHTNIVPVFEVGQDSEYSFYAMQLIQGQGLDHVIDDLLELRRQRSEPGVQPVNDRLSRARIADQSVAASLVRGHFQQQRLVDSDGDDAANSESRQTPAHHEVALTETLIEASGSTVSASLPGHTDFSTAEDNHRAYFRSVAEIGLQCARALSYAHARGITHRDIKPSNLLLDTAGVVWITDFGLAHTTDSSMTQTGDILGTLRYMSPERFKGQCDNRADVYSLGLTLYELVVLRPAFESPDRLQLIEVVSKQEVTPPRSIDSRVPRDLETIILKASDKEPRRRYQSADELAEDLQRFINDEPIQARRTTLLERFARWSRRNPGLASSMSVAFVGLMAAACALFFYAREQHRFAEDQNELNGELQASNAAKQNLLNEQRRLNDERIRMIDELRAGKSRLARKQAEYDFETGSIADGMAWLAHSLELASPHDAAFREEILGRLGLAFDRFPRLQTIIPLEPAAIPRSDARTIQTSLVGSSRGVFSPRRYSRDGSYLIVTEGLGSEDSGDGVDGATQWLRVWDVQQGQFIGRTIATGANAVVALSPSHEFLAILTPASIEELRAESQSVQSNTPRPTRQTNRLNVLRNGQRPNPRSEWSLEIRDAMTGRLRCENAVVLNTYRSGANADIAFTQDGSELLILTREIVLGSRSAVGPARNRLYRFHAETGEALGMLESPGMSRDFRFSPDATRVVLMRQGFDRRSATIEIRDVTTLERVGQPIRLAESPESWLVCTSDASRIATVVNFSGRPSLIVWDSATGKTIGGRHALPEHFQTLRLLDISADGLQWVISAGSREPRLGVEERDLDTTRYQLLFGDSSTGERLVMPMSNELNAALLGPNAEFLLAVDQSSLRTWELPGPQLRRVVLPNLGPDSRGAQARHTEAIARLMLRRSGLIPGLGCLASSSDGEVVMVQSDARSLDVSWWEPRTGRILDRQVLATKDFENPFCLNVAGTSIATVKGDALAGSPVLAGLTSSIRCRDLRTGEQIGVDCSMDGLAIPMALRNDASRVVVSVRGEERGTSAFGGPAVRRRPASFSVYDTATGRLIDLPRRLNLVGPVRFASYLDDGSLVVSNLVDPVLLRWNEATGIVDEVPLPGTVFADLQISNSSLVGTTASLSRDGRRMAISPDGKTVEVWDLERGWRLGSPLRHSAVVNEVAFSSDGRTLLTASNDGLVRQWALPAVWSGTTEEIADRVASLTGQTLDAAGRFHVMAVDVQMERAEFNASPRTEKIETLNRFERRAITDRDNGQWASAIAGFQRWSERHPDDGLPHLLMASCLLELGRYEQSQQAIHKAAVLTDRESISRWLEQEVITARLNRSIPTGSEELQVGDRQVWYFKQLFLLNHADEQRVREIFERDLMARLHVSLQRDERPEPYQRLLDELIELVPQNITLREKRIAWCSERSDWNGAIVELQELCRLDPDDHWSRFRLAPLLVYVHDDKAFRELARETVDRWEYSTKPRTMERTAKMGLIFHDIEAEMLPRLVAMAQRGVEDTSDDTQARYVWHDLLAMGMAAHRQGHHDDAVRILDDVAAKFDASGGSGVIYTALAQLFAAMSLEQDGQHAQALARYFAAVDRIEMVYHRYVASRQLGSPTDWFYAEVARREAEQLLGVNADSIGLPLPDTSNWEVVYADDFERTSLGDDWRANADWSIESGAAVCLLDSRGPAPANAEWRASSMQQDLRLPETVLVEFDTWWPEPAGSVGRIVQSRRGYFAQLCSVPDPEVVAAGGESTGAFLLVKDENLYLKAEASDFQVVPNQTYHVQILRQRNRVTMFVNDQQILSQLVHSMSAPILVLSGQGPDGARVYFDNLKVSLPTVEAQLFRARRLSAVGEFEQAVPLWRELLAGDPENMQHFRIAASILTDEATDHLWSALPAELRPAWEAVSGRPLSSVGSFRPVDLQSQANLLLKSNFHTDDDQGLSNIPQGLREFAGVQYQVGTKCLHLVCSFASPNSRIAQFPSEFSDIAAAGRFRRLHLLHTVGFGSRSEDGTTIAELVLHYVDGTSATLEIVNGVHARDWWDLGDSEVSDGEVVWRVQGDRQQESPSRRLYHSVWDNPHPDRELQSLDLKSIGTGAASICVAISLED